MVLKYNQKLNSFIHRALAYKVSTCVQMKNLNKKNSIFLFRVWLNHYHFLDQIFIHIDGSKLLTSHSKCRYPNIPSKNVFTKFTDSTFWKHRQTQHSRHPQQPTQKTISWSTRKKGGPYLKHNNQQQAIRTNRHTNHVLFSFKRRACPKQNIYIWFDSWSRRGRKKKYLAARRVLIASHNPLA